MTLTSRSPNQLGIVLLQMQLRKLGVYSGLIDGAFNHLTYQGVTRFQHSRGLVIDGIVGPNTQAALKASTGSAWFSLCLHCSASPEGMHFTGEQVSLMHTLPKNKGGRGWSRPGYSDIFELDGSLTNIRNWDQDDLINEWEYTFGVKYNTLMNSNSRHVCYIGGTERHNMNKIKDTRTEAQHKSIETYVRFCLLRNPDLVIYGHNQVQNKGCPSFDVPSWLDSIGIDKHNQACWGRLFK